MMFTDKQQWVENTRIYCNLFYIYMQSSLTKPIQYNTILQLDGGEGWYREEWERETGKDSRGEGKGGRRKGWERKGGGGEGWGRETVGNRQYLRHSLHSLGGDNYYSYVRWQYYRQWIKWHSAAGSQDETSQVSCWVWNVSTHQPTTRSVTVMLTRQQATKPRPKLRAARLRPTKQGQGLQQMSFPGIRMSIKHFIFFCKILHTTIVENHTHCNKQTVCKSVVVTKLTYAAWWGFAMATDRQRVEAAIRRSMCSA